MRLSIVAAMAAGLASASTIGCMAPVDGASGEDSGELAETHLAAVLSANGLMSINGLTSANGLMSINGAMNVNGITATGPLNGSGLLSANTTTGAKGLMSTAAGRSTVSYLVKCALKAGRSITKKDQYGVAYTFSGGLGFAPEWEASTCGTTCQTWVTACMMAHVNTAGVHVPLWLDASHPNVGFGQSASYPLQEGSFFGNIFTSPPQAYYCNGMDFNDSVVPGRIGADQVGAPYKAIDTLSAGSKQCSARCAGSDSWVNGKRDGYKSCLGWNQVVTVWRHY